jgi:hypothetical protein
VSGDCLSSASNAHLIDEAFDQYFTMGELGRYRVAPRANVKCDTYLQAIRVQR